MQDLSGDKHNPLLFLFHKTWVYSAGNRRTVALYWTLFVVASSLSLFSQPLLGAKIMNVIQADGITERSLQALLTLLALMLGLKFAFWCFHGPGRVLENISAFKARSNYRKHLLKGVMTLPMEWHVEHHSGDTIDKVEKGTSALFQFSRDSFEVVYSIVQLAGSFGMLVYFYPTSGWFVLGMMCISMWITMRFDRVMIPQYRALNKSENQISENTFDTIANISTVIILRVEKLVFNSISQRIDLPFGLFKRNNTLNEAKWFATSMCTSVMTFLVMGSYFYDNLGASKGVLVGTVFILYKYLEEMGDVFFRFTSMYSDIVVRKSRVLNAEELSSEFRPENFTNHLLPKNWRRLEVRNLSFSYDGLGATQSLIDVELDLLRGESIALIGESGSGKTTLLKIIRHLYHPQTLELSVDDRPMLTGFEGISRAIALVPQNPEIFGTTIRENITLGAEYDEAFIRRFTDMACFTQVVASLPKGFESSIKEKGVNLSGGQQQRLALARGLLACHDKDIVLLDEPTSSLDTATEMRIYKNIFAGFRGKTIISSIHRLHLLPYFDKIYSFENGVITASGTFDELRNSNPNFRGMWARYIAQESEENAVVVGQ